MRVTHTIQSPGNDPVTYNYTRADVDPINAMAAVASIMATDYSDQPESIRVKTLAITITF